MRLYSFANYYLSPLQHGLQTAHCVSEMSQLGKIAELRVFNEWAMDHKTVIILNGGNSKMISDTYDLFEAPAKKLGLPLVKFYEDEQSLGGALTSCAIVLPEDMYNAQSLDEKAMNPLWFVPDENGCWNDSVRRCRPEENIIISHIKRHRLA